MPEPLHTADQCRAKAEECDLLADEAKDTETKRDLKKAADQWRQAATIVERNGW
jgi:hypothetical protein